MVSNSEPRYVISVVARMVGVHAQTLRYYEKMGLIEPQRSSGKIRLYSDQDVELLRRVRKLMEDLGVNLAGVEVILRLMGRMVELQKQLDAMEAEVKRLQEAGL